MLLKYFIAAAWLPRWNKDLLNSPLVDALEGACMILEQTMEEWFANNPELLIHPRKTIDESTLGMHQDWYTNLMPFRTVTLEDRRKIYLFQCHIDDLITSLKATGYDQSYHFVLK